MIAEKAIRIWEGIVALTIPVSVLALNLLASVENSQATTYYVSTNGSDNNSCATAQTPGASAKRNLTGANGAVEQCMRSGDTVIVQAGSYTLPGNGLFDVIPPGTGENSRTILKCEGFRTCTLNGQIWLRDNDDYITIQDFRINGNFSALHAITLTATSLTASLYPSHVKIVGNELYNTTTEILYDGNGEFNEFLNNYLHHCSGANCNAIYGLGRKSIYRGNVTDHARGVLSLHTSGGLVPSDNLVENNIVNDCLDSNGANRWVGINLAGTAGNIVRRNIVRNCTYGVRAGAGSSTNSSLDHNVFHGNVSGGVSIILGSGNQVRNNIALDNTGPAIQLCSGCGVVGMNLTTGTPTAIWTNPAQGDYTLRAASPAIDACAYIGLTYNGTAPDCGAFESGGNSGGGDTAPPQPPSNLRVQ